MKRRIATFVFGLIVFQIIIISPASADSRKLTLDTSTLIGEFSDILPSDRFLFNENDHFRSDISNEEQIAQAQVPPALKTSSSQIISRLLDVTGMPSGSHNVQADPPPDDWPTDAQSTTGPEPPPDIQRGVSRLAAVDADQLVLGVPAYIWHNGCGPTAAGMVIGYWDGKGYDDLVAGSAATQTAAVDAMISSTGNYADYCLPLDMPPNLLPDLSEPPTGDEHLDDSIADLMKTSQSFYSNYYGWSWFSYMDDALEEYVQVFTPDYFSRAQNQVWGVFTWESFRTEVDAGRPVVLLVDTDADGSTDHFVTAIGYSDDSGTNMYAVRDTWDTGIHWFEFAQMTEGQPWGIYGATLFEIGSTHCGTISSNEVWMGDGQVHIVSCDLTVMPGVTLEIQAGAIVKFDPNVGLTVNGALRVLGSPSNPVYLTSYRDDTIGGDTNGDGGSTGARGDWDWIEFTDTSDDTTSLIDHAVIRYGGRNFSPLQGAVHLSEASPVIQNTTFEENQYCSLTADLRSFPTLTGNTYQDNDLNALCLKGGTVDLDATWGVTDVSYYLLDNVTVGVGSSLTVDPGVIVKVGSNRQLTIDGALRVEGTGADPVYFTSYRDDAVGGDTNGDGGSTGAQGDWDWIEFTDTSDDTTSLIDHAVIRYGGLNSFPYRGAIHLSEASPTIQRSSIVLNEYAGISVHSSDPILVCNNVYGNQIYGMFSDTPGTLVRAVFHWWGDASGPYHPSTNPTGLGNEVTGGFDYRPWLSFPCTDSTTFLYLPLIMR